MSTHEELKITRDQNAKYKGCISNSGHHFAALRVNGTVFADSKNAARNMYGECETDTWRNIISVSAGGYDTLTTLGRARFVRLLRR